MNPRGIPDKFRQILNYLVNHIYKKKDMEMQLFSDGLYVCLERFAGFCNDHVMGYYKRTARKGFLWCKQIKKMLPEAEEPQDKVTKVCEIL